ncbi:hypothetical protein [Cytobacillus sp. IB215316]|uniref:hypothetical protein n=1 Tax=Cytobacillus sp. IB215316 TaxID=3097354 RepID=UPI002A0EF282|nr:hypothetical protein [Cytobacillus sp. IB215316]MDX8360318.1 hypothetical protein [Cytobacillus sp. IB215316]
MVQEKCCKELCSQEESPNIDVDIDSTANFPIFKSVPDNIGKIGMITVQNRDIRIKLTFIPVVGNSIPMTIDINESRTIPFRNIKEIMAQNDTGVGLAQFAYSICTFLDPQENCCPILCSQTNPDIEVDIGNGSTFFIFQDIFGEGKTGMVSIKKDGGDAINLTFVPTVGIEIPVPLANGQSITVPFENIKEIKVFNNSGGNVEFKYSICTLLDPNKSINK